MPEPTTEALEHLRQTHDEGCLTLKRRSYDSENIKVAVEVERHRWYWKPKHPKLLLVAESHVLTTELDLEFRTNEAAIRRFLDPKASLPPDRFVRLVYCLAYGESQLLTTIHPQRNNPGTPRYWDIFGQVTFRGLQPRLEDGAVLHDRVRWKIDTLREMYRMGIWLLDASVHAIYLRNGKRLPADIRSSLHEQWWRNYGRHVIDSSCDGAKIWVIGSDVFKCLSLLSEWPRCEWVYQSNAANYQTNAAKVDMNRNWPQLLEDCSLIRPRLKG